jgi:hypothetical protein
MYRCKVYLKLFYTKSNYLYINIIDKSAQVIEVPCMYIHI